MAAAAVAVSLALVGCASETPTQAELTDALVDSGIPRKVAACSSKAIIGTLSDKELRVLVERGGGGGPVDDPKRTDDSADKLREALGTCREMITPATTVPPTTDTVVPDDGAAGGGVSTTVPVSNDDEFNTTTSTTRP